MNETGGGTSRVYRFADLTLDAGRHSLRRGSRELSLPGKSFDLLAALVRAAPDSLSTDDLMERVWRGSIVNQATVAKRVELLRQVLDDDSAAPRYIALIRGHGYRLIPNVREVHRKSLRVNARLYAVAAVIVLLIAGTFAWFALQPGPPPPDRSIAVLPFVAVSTNPDDQVFADGLTEELGHVLASGGNLKVTGRISSFQFKNSDEGVQTIGEKLDVAHLLNGSVRRSGGRLRVTAELTSTADGFSLWSASFDRQVSDIIGIQEDIAHNVAARLKVSLSRGTSHAIVDETSISPEAYAMYLRAVSLSPYGKGLGLEEAQTLAREVTRLAPDFAPGWNRLAAIHGRRLFFRDPEYPYSLEEAMLIMIDAVDKAMTIDPESAEAYANLGGSAWVLEGDALKAAPLIERALELDPWNLDIISFAGDFAKYIGRFDEALQLEELLVDREPLCTECRIRLAKSYTYVGRYADAEREFLTLRTMEGGYAWNLGVVKLMLEQPDQALEIFDTGEIEAHLRKLGRAAALCDLNLEEPARVALAEFNDVWSQEYPQLTAMAYAHCGLHDSAFEWLERSLPERTVKLQTEFPEPLYRSLRDDPRWREIKRRIGRSKEQTDSIPFSLDNALARLTR